MEYVKESILKPGTIIRLKKQFGYPVDGIIKGVFVGANSIEYYIGYFSNGKFEKEYIPIEMFEVVGDPLPTGFQIPNKNL